MISAVASAGSEIKFVGGLPLSRAATRPTTRTERSVPSNRSYSAVVRASGCRQTNWPLIFRRAFGASCPRRRATNVQRSAKSVDMDVVTPMADAPSDDQLFDDTSMDCEYQGTTDKHIKIYLIGAFASAIALLSIILNTFLTIVFLKTPSLRSTPLFYFGVLAVIDIIMGFNYLALLSVQFYMDYFNALWLYHLFLSYLRPLFAESCAAMFSSTLFIVVATFERFLKTLQSSCFVTTQKWMERHRPLVSFGVILVAVSYKACIYFEITYEEHVNCTGFAQYSVALTPLSTNSVYTFWWMFVTRNLVDRIIPFFSLVIMNFLVIRTLKRERRRQSGGNDEVVVAAVTVSRNALRDATRCLVSIVSMYLMSQSLQIVIIFWEVLHKDSLEKQFTVFYSYANDAISIMTLLSSCLRLPVYCAWNKPIASAAALALRQAVSICRLSWPCAPASSKNNEAGYRSVLYSNTLQQSNGNLGTPSPNHRQAQYAWIITGGTATGVMKYVGDALKEHQLSTGFADSKRLVAIGIAAWGCIDNNVCLEDADGDGSFPAVYSIRDCAEGFAPLDHNHTCFILVDNGTANIYGTEIALRAKLEAHIRTKCAASGVHTPVVLIVCEGGVNTLEQTRDAIKCAIPVVVIKGSGRAADIISAAYRMTKPKHGDEQSTFPDDYRTKMETLISRMFGSPDQDMIDMAVGHLEMILSQRSLITIFEMSDVSCRDLDKAVLSALLKAKKANPLSQINLALIWNRADIARHEIFTLENRKQWQHVALDEAMFDALMQGKQQFVQLFIDNGVQLNRFLTIRRLRDLYRASMQENDTMAVIFKNLILKAKMYEDFFSIGCSRVGVDESDSCLLKDVGKVINLLLNDEYNCMYTEEKFVVRPGAPEPKDEEQRPSSAAKFYDFKSSERELFLWALLFNKAELADLLWKMCSDPIGGALVACRLLKSLAKEAAQQEEIDISDSLRRQADEFEEVACGVLASCYCRNKDNAQRLLTRELNSWGKVTLFALAESAHLMEFMKLGCCQTKLNSIWFGRMVDYTKDYKIIMVLLCPLLIGIIRFKSKEVPLTAVVPADEPFQQTSSERSVTKIHRYVTPPIAWLCQKTHRAREDVIGPIRALYEFYSSPVAKFYLSMGFYMIYLCLFTYVVLARLEPLTIDKKFTFQGLMEAILWGWALCFFLEEIRQVVRREARSVLFKIANHMKSFWNLLDLVIFLLFVVAVVLRLQPQPDPYARVIYAVTLMFSYLRFMETFYVSKIIGPKIIMIQRMLRDLIFFICILVVFILSFGFAMQSLLYPHMRFSSALLADAVYTPYSQVFGELSIDKGDGSAKCTTNVTEYDENDNDNIRMCPERTWLVRVLFAVYMMLTNVLLMNILIAMFSYTFQAVQDNSEKVWRFYRYSVVYEYFDAPALPVPLVLLVHFKRWVFFFYRRFCSHTFYANTGFKERLPLEDNLRLSTFEKTERDRFLAQRSRLTFEQMDSKLNEAGARLQQLMEDIQDIKETIVGEADLRATSSRGRAKSAIDSDRPISPSQLAPQIVSMEEKIDRQTELMRELVKALKKTSQAAS
uniref:G-protein coupled receptors family 1 profile domain-containing protein n=1 Tax=Plectus sambesii TaxID=2011161 RepID=A0A914UJE4_9BILA